ncbi:MAG: hypothetical protein FJ220_02990 [Kiritimatiellaceae bacterium]|nr:hypothetical protein [Kiritimatiellaceae bacterium]
MKKHNRLTLVIMAIAGFIQSGIAADTNVFLNGLGDNDWNNADNWQYQRVALPPDIASLGRSAAVVLTTSNLTGAVRLGCIGFSSLIIDGGSLTALNPADWNSVGYNDPASLTIQNGGSLTTASILLVGRKNSRGGTVVIRQGSLRVKEYAHNKYYQGTEIINTRTTIYPEGVLEADLMDLNAGVLDIAGGTVIIRQSNPENLDKWIKEGRIVAMGGLDGWVVNVAIDEETGWVTLTAKQEEVLLGMLSTHRMI